MSPEQVAACKFRRHPGAFGLWVQDRDRETGLALGPGLPWTGRALCAAPGKTLLKTSRVVLGMAPRTGGS